MEIVNSLEIAEDKKRQLGTLRTHSLSSGHLAKLRDTPSTAGNSMTGSERPSPEPLLKKERRPQPYWGGENSGNALEASNALNYRDLGDPRGEFQETL